MARPRRPSTEATAVQAAADLLRAEGIAGDTSIAAETARRTVKALLEDVNRDPNDPLLTAMAEVEQRLFPSPFVTLACSPDIDTAAEFVEERVRHLRARGGRFQSDHEQRSEREAVASTLTAKLSARYLRTLRARR